MSSTIRSVRRIACVLAAAIVVAGITTGAASAEDLGPPVGVKAPDIGTRPDQTGKPRTLPDLMGKNGLVLMFFRSADWCPYCQRAKGLLTQKNIVFSEINVEEDVKFRDEMIARSNRRTVPQIFLGDKHIGGCEDLYALNDSGELDRLIQGAG